MYDVEGVRFPRPFRIRRFGHFGFNLNSVDAGLDFYGRLLGFDMTDLPRLRMLEPNLPRELEDDRIPFLTHNTDHHSMILAHRTLGSMFGDDIKNPEITLSHFTWQVGSLREVHDAHHYLAEKGVEIRRTGRDMPGSNWHVYMVAPEGHTVELYYGMEQVGINGRSKPLGYYDRRFETLFPLPQISDASEKAAAAARGVTMADGFDRQSLGGEARYDVGGVLLQRPFKVTSHGPIGLFVDDMAASLAFYRDTLGFRVTEVVTYQGQDCVFLGHGREHHSLKLYPIALRSALGLSGHTTTASMGMRVGSYRQLRDAVAWLRAEGVRFIEQPPELSPGIDYCAYALDNDGHCIQLFYEMEQLGWDGQTRPAALRRSAQTPWPETLEASPDSYIDQAFMGPIG